MNKCGYFAQIAFAAAAIAAPQVVFAQTELTPGVCQPLTEANLSACCAASNWQELILPGEVAYCPRLNDDDNDSGRLGQGIGTAATTGTATTGPAATDPVTTEPAGTAPTAQTTGATGDSGTSATAENPNSGAGNNGETGATETTSADSDPGNSGPNNNAPADPPGQTR